MHKYVIIIKRLSDCWLKIYSSLSIKVRKKEERTRESINLRQQLNETQFETG